FVRPVSHSVRLFANMLAGHITLKVFGGFVTMLGAAGILGWLGAVMPFALTVAMTALELLVAFLQAYVFAILTCIYLNDAIHPGHCPPDRSNRPNAVKGASSWIRLPQNTLVLESPASAWAALASASAQFSATISRPRCAILPPRKASSAT